MRTQRGAVAVVSGVLLLTLLCAVGLGNAALLALDAEWHGWVLDQRGHALSEAAVVVTDTGVGPCAYGLAAVSGAVAVARPGRWLLGALVGMAALLAGQWLRSGLATAMGRARPPVADWITHPAGFAFPSGHTTTSALVAMGVAAVLYRRARRPATRVAAVAVPALWAFAVGLSRIYLGVHWPSDVLAGWLLATLLACAFLPPLAAVLGRIGQDRSDQSSSPRRQVSSTEPMC